ncbi:MAG: AAA family ATPase [Myxococcota bacterium]
MEVLTEILTWSRDRPDWQRDALRRLVTVGDLDGDDIDELALICKAEHGLAEPQDHEPLADEHLPSGGAYPTAVSLTDLTHHGGVNALAADQRIAFSPSLTIVYGANAAGKSGYTRILKSACRARGAEDVLGNVLSGAPPGQPNATIRFMVGDDNKEDSWTGEAEASPELSQVKVFDSHCASVYLREKTDVAFRPFGLDLFDKLSNTCEAVKEIVEREQNALAAAPNDLPDLPEETAAHRIASRITSLTSAEKVREVGTLSETEIERLAELKKASQDMRSDDPAALAQTLRLRAQRLRSLASDLGTLSNGVSSETIRALADAQGARSRAAAEAERTQQAALADGLLNGTGSETWKTLWEAARRFSNAHAYTDHEFPATHDRARCVLCQQNLERAAVERLCQLEDLVQSTAQKQLDEASTEFNRRLRHLEDLSFSGESINTAVEDLRIEAEQLAETVERALAEGSETQSEVVSAVSAKSPIPATRSIRFPTEEVNSQAQAVENRATLLTSGSDPSRLDRLVDELQELEARASLSKKLQGVLDEIERQKRLAAYQVCLKDTGTGAITRKNTEVTKRVVTERLASSFLAELARLKFAHVEMELRAAGGARGTLFHEIVLKRAPGVEVPKVVSEGEGRTLSIAAFFAELSTAENPSAILFDDPVSSLDHDWRENVARRLAEESLSRQVVVFTHDIVFMVALAACAEEVGAECKHQYVRQERNIGAGVASPDLPWIAMKTRDRIGVLRKMHQGADKIFRTRTETEYEREAILIYGFLREAWERALEEVLLGGVVERYRKSVQTRQIIQLSRITKEECETLESAMTKCSRFLPGHDKSPAENPPLPDGDELRKDIDTIDHWVKAINKRR